MSIPAARQTLHRAESPILDIRKAEGFAPSPFGSRVEAPRDQPPAVNLLRLLIITRSVFFLQVGGEKIDLAAGHSVRHALQVRQFDKSLPRGAVRFLQRRRVAAFTITDRVAADDEAAVSLRRDQPPAPVDFLLAEAACRLKVPGVEPSSEAVEPGRIKPGSRISGQFAAPRRGAVRRMVTFPANPRRYTVPLTSRFPGGGRQP